MATLLCLALGLASCGGGSGSESTTGGSTTSTTPDTKPSAEVKTAASDDQRDEPAEGDGARSGAQDPCQARLGNFVDRMTDLRQSLLAGLSYDEYVVRVQAIGDAYRAVPVDRLGVSCLSGPAAKAEDAFNQYLRAANVWGDCAGTAGCAAGEIEGKLQRRWKIASKSLDAMAKS